MSIEQEKICAKLLTVPTKEELDAEIAKGMDDIRNGRTFTAKEVRAEMEEVFGI